MKVGSASLEPFTQSHEAGKGEVMRRSIAAGSWLRFR
jgi:hypothetical protein